MNIDTIHLVELTSLSHDGRAVGRLVDDPQGRVIFVEHALPGQVVRARITKSKKSFAEALCLEVVQEAPHSQAAPCVHAEHCGGCPLQTLQPEAQLYWKERMVHEAMTRIAKLPPENMQCIDPIVPSPQAWGYRNKMEFAFGQAGVNGEYSLEQAGSESVAGHVATNKEGDSLVLGLRAKGSHAVMPVPHCLLMPKECLAIVQSLRLLCQKAGFRAWQGATPLKSRGKTTSNKGEQEPVGVLRHAVLRRPHTLQENGQAQLLVNLITAPAGKNARLRLSRIGQELLQLHPHITGFVLEERRSASMVAQGEQTICTLGQNVLREQLGAITYDFGHNAFFQVNTAAAQNLCGIVKNMAQEALDGQEASCLWDVYCGVGAPGLALAPLTSALYGVEINEKAITIARKNAQRAGFTHCQYTAGDAKDILPSWPRPDLILLDPPRMGLHADSVQQLLQALAKHIIYISCNPATLARDMALLSARYSLQKLVPLDFFPQTAHVESCALLALR